MSNSYFRFKQFRIEQDQCAMKVSTDACIQGAWTPLKPGIKRVLDAGTGTGLLSLMLAQRDDDLLIDAIELDENAAAQAAENVKRSPFASRIDVIKADIRSWIPATKYDLIICNPPFFKDSLLGKGQSRNNARHHLTLQQEDLVQLMKHGLDETGYACLMWPLTENQRWQELLEENGFSIGDSVAVKDKDHTRITRIISTCSRLPDGTRQSQALLIKNNDDSYTEPFRELMAPFYLQL